MTGFAILSTTLPRRDDARAMARLLVEQRLAACVQIVPVESVYRWEDTTEEAAEHLLLCKIREHEAEAVGAAIRARHPYDIPEIVVVPIAWGSPPYLGWLDSSL